MLWIHFDFVIDFYQILFYLYWIVFYCYWIIFYKIK